MNTLALISPRRQRVDRLARWALMAGVILALAPLALVLLYVLKRGVGALSLSFFTTDPTGAFFGDQGGIKSAILGTIEIVALATAIAVPIGVTLAVYLNEVGRKSKLAMAVRYFVDVLTGVPSILFGLFIYIVFVIGGMLSGFAAWKGSAALALLMLPVVTRTSEVSLALVPDSLREAALALGAPRWRVILRVVLPTALPGLLTGALLAVARASGETAPLLFTVLGAQATTFSLGAQMNSLPLQIFNDVREPNPQLVTRAWGAALTLI
ncbi:MAG TPA: phosphate ABC transporter permease PstA, partial [Candidatus Dormibacteraeota bacterium]|nr:phosphate ABC transporter permease PstA [Candidatus Dormibacteraeota bacterium]